MQRDDAKYDDAKYGGQASGVQLLSDASTDDPVSLALSSIRHGMNVPFTRRNQILLFALLLRGGLILAAWIVAHTSAPFLAPDSVAYLETARSLATAGEFSQAGDPEIIRTPGLPLLLVPGMWIDAPVIWGLLLHVACAALSLLAVHDLVRQLSNDRRASIAALIMAIEPLGLVYTAKLLTEATFATCLILALWGLLSGHLRQSKRHWTLGAALLGISALIRPIGFALSLLLGMLALVAWVYQLMRRRCPLPGAWWVTASLLLLLPSLGWQLRNHVVADYHGLSAITDINLYFYQAAAVTAAIEDRPFYEVQDELGYHDVTVFNARRPDLRALDPGPRMHQLGAEGRSVLAAHPLIYLKIHLQGMTRVLLDPGGVELLRLLGQYPARGGLLGRLVDDGIWATLVHVAREAPWVLPVEAGCGLLLFFVYGTAMRGLLHLSRQRLTIALLLGGAVLVLLVASGGPMSLGRFRHPIMPLLCLLSGLGLPGRLATGKDG